MDIRCASCRQKLRIGDNLLGTKISCPRCKKAFLASAEDAAAPAPKPSSAVKVEPQAPARDQEQPDEGYRFADDDKPEKSCRKAAPPPDEEPEVERDEGEEEERGAGPKRRWRRSDIQALVSYPANALKAGAFLFAAWVVYNQCLIVGVFFGLPIPGLAPFDQPPIIAKPDVVFLLLRVMVFVLFLVAAWVGWLIRAADCMRGLVGYWTALSGALGALLPLFCLGWKSENEEPVLFTLVKMTLLFVTASAGVWAAVTLSLKGVSEAFPGNAENRRTFARVGAGSAVVMLLVMAAGAVLLLANKAGRKPPAAVAEQQPIAARRPPNAGGMPPIAANQLEEPREVDPRPGFEPERAQPRPPVEQPKPVESIKFTGDAAIDAALNDLESSKMQRQRQAAQALANMKPKEEHRAVVAQKLADAGLADNHFTRKAQVRALCVWATEKEIPTLIAYLDHQDRAVRGEVLNSIGKLRDERIVAPVIRCFVGNENRRAAAQALRDLGPIAEKDLLPLAAPNPRGDVFLRVEIVKILGDIGTEKSVPVLQAVIFENNLFLAKEARLSLFAIQTRLKKK